MNPLECFDCHLDTKIFNSFQNIALSDLHLTQAKYEVLRSSCGYFSLPSDENKEMKMPIQLSILHINARSIYSNEKFDEFQLFLERTQCTWQIICVSETWLSDESVNSHQLSGFTGYFNNRANRNGGGVAIYVNDKYVKHSHEIKLNKLTSTESVFVECEIPGLTKFIVSTIYKPPDLENKLFLDELAVSLE